MEAIDKIIAQALETNSGLSLNEPTVVYGSPFSNRLKLIQLIRSGLPQKLFEKLQQLIPFTELDWAEVLNVSSKTLQRSKKDKHFTYKPIHTEKILEIAEVTQFGITVFGNKITFKDWLNTPSAALGNNTPKELLKDSFGKELVMQELNNIEHGIFA